MKTKTEKAQPAEKLRIKEMNEETPLGMDGVLNDNEFRWYRVKNKNDYNVLNAAYGKHIREPSVYPEIICVEAVGQEAYGDEAYACDYHMSACKAITEHFWKQLGYQCTIEKG